MQTDFYTKTLNDAKNTVLNDIEKYKSKDYNDY